MGHSELPVELESLLAHTGWLRRLARGLLGDEAAAADAVQTTLLTAVERPPATLQNPRGWFGAVLLNTIRGGARKRRTAERAMRAATEPDAPSVPTPEDVVSNLEMQRRVASLVQRLDPSVAQVVYLRFFEDLESAEIGRRLAMPAGTVRWRLKLGLDELRAMLDAEDRRDGARSQAWRSLMVGMFPPTARTSLPRMATASGGLLPWLLSGAAGVGIIAMGVWVSSRADADAGRSDISLPQPPTQPRTVGTRRGSLPTFVSDPAPNSSGSDSEPTANTHPRTQVPGGSLAARRSAPFSALTWKDGRPWVRVGADVVELLAVDGHSIDAIAAHVSKSHPSPPDTWRKRLGEELVEDLTAMGHPPGEHVRLEIRRDDGTRAFVDAAMAIENRDAIKARRKAAKPPAAPAFDPYAKVSPFTSVAFVGEQLMVQVAGAWYRLVAIEGVSAERWMEVARAKFGPQWQKRIAEDPVEALTPALGSSPGESVDLDLAAPETGQLLRLDQVPMTEENRRQVKATWR
jgi:RNA polymerase sigma-70 factor (ECF subfamily)